MAPNRLAFLRADASKALGGGHIFRCLTLADALAANGWRCTFVCKAGTREAVPALGRSRHTIVDLRSSDESDFLKALLSSGADLLVVDHYGLDARLEAACRPWARRIMVLDDGTGRRHDCDILLDQNLGARNCDYHGLVPAHCCLLTGPSYALLRPQFLRARRKALARRATDEPARRLLISLGATDPMNITTSVVAAAASLPLEIDVVLSTGSEQKQAVQDISAHTGLKVQLHADVDDMSALMTSADLAVGAAGSTSWERCCLGLPSLLLVLADNQRRVAESLSLSGAAKIIGAVQQFSTSEMLARLQELAANNTKRHAMAVRAASICDGRGTQRVLLALLHPTSVRDGKAITLRLATNEDESTILEWQRHSMTRRYARNPLIPTPKEHHLWMSDRLSDIDSFFTIIECEGKPSGVLRLDRRGTESQSYEVSILVAPEQYRQGIGNGVLAIAQQLLPNAELVAEVLPQNEASMKLFTAAGYQRYDDGLLHCPPTLMGEGNHHDHFC